MLRKFQDCNGELGESLPETISTINLSVFVLNKPPTRSAWFQGQNGN